MNIEQAKAIPIVKILENLNLKPSRILPHESWFLSPWREEKTASLHVHNEKNLWFDFGEAVGGDVIKLVQEILKGQGKANSVSDALSWLDNTMGGNVVYLPIKNVRTREPKQPALSLEKIGPIQNSRLLGYLDSRGIPVSVASKATKQAVVLNANTDKRFSALAWKNEHNGYELTNPLFKGTVGEKTISFIRGTEVDPEAIHFFEGMMDYLTVVTRHEGRRFRNDCIILNSVSNIPHVMPYLYQYGYSVGYTWMDNDEAGRKAELSLKHIFQQEHILIAHNPMNEVYRPFKDVNAWHMHKLGL